MARAIHRPFWARILGCSLAAIVVALLGATTAAHAQCGDCTSYGTGALASLLPTAFGDSAFGNLALNADTDGSGNTATGAYALGNNTGGSANTATGAYALQYNTIGGGNTATGVDALHFNTGSANTATGDGALQSNTSGELNTATGLYALHSNTTGRSDTATGVLALQSNTTGGANTATGQGALYANTTGSNNIAVGFEAGQNLYVGDDNIYIGNNGGSPYESNIIRIGTQGTQTATYLAGIFGTTLAPLTYRAVVVDSIGHLGTTPPQGTPRPGSLPSSARYKRDIRGMGAASRGLMKLRPVSFRYKEDPKGALQYGLIAEEVRKVYPELVTYGADGKIEGVRYELLPAMLVNEMQKQGKQIKRLAEQLKKKDAQIDALIARINTLERQARPAKAERLAAAR